MITDIPDLGLMGEEIESPSGSHRLFYGDSVEATEPLDNKVVLFINGGRSPVIEVDWSVTRAVIFNNGFSALELYDRKSRKSGLAVLNPAGAVVQSVPDSVDIESLKVDDSGNIIARPL